MKPRLAFDTSALIPLGLTDLVGTILKNYQVIVTSTVIDELRNMALRNDEYGRSAAVWLKVSDLLISYEIKEEEKQPYAEQDLFSICIRENIPLVTDDIKAMKKFGDDLHCFFSVHIIYLLMKKGFINLQKGLISLERMKVARDWKDNQIYTIGRMLFE